MVLFDLTVLKQKMSVQKVHLLINQEHEIFYSLSKLIILYMYLVPKYNAVEK